jgi:hypothetical protein
MGIGLALVAVGTAIVLGLLRNLWTVPFDFLAGKPIRIDLPLPYIPIDVVLVSNPDHITVSERYGLRWKSLIICLGQLNL